MESSWKSSDVGCEVMQLRMMFEIMKVYEKFVKFCIEKFKTLLLSKSIERSADELC